MPISCAARESGGTLSLQPVILPVHLSRCIFAAPETSRTSARKLRHACSLRMRPSFVRGCTRELPYFVAQKYARLSRDLSAKRNAPFRKASPAAGLLEGNVSFLFYFDENVTVAEWVKSANRIRDLDFRGEQPPRCAARHAVVAAQIFESISLPSAPHGVFVNCSRRPRSQDQRGF